MTINLQKPDITELKPRICVFVDGCFWHGCPKCVDGTRSVKSNGGYWIAKVRGNQERDRRQRERLTTDGWDVLTIWECEVRDPVNLDKLAEMIRVASDRFKAKKRTISC